VEKQLQTLCGSQENFGEVQINSEKSRETPSVTIWLEGNSEKTFKLNQLSVKFRQSQCCSRYAVFLFLHIIMIIPPLGENGAHAW
jgi:hypothetical protein